MGDGPTSQHQHSSIFLGDSITGDESNHCQGKSRYDVSTDGEVNISWG